jgi:hypothetical protein
LSTEITRTNPASRAARAVAGTGNAPSSSPETFGPRDVRRSVQAPKATEGFAARSVASLFLEDEA